MNGVASPPKLKAKTSNQLSTATTSLHLEESSLKVHWWKINTSFSSQLLPRPRRSNPRLDKDSWERRSVSKTPSSEGYLINLSCVCRRRYKWITVLSIIRILIFFYFRITHLPQSFPEFYFLLVHVLVSVCGFVYSGGFQYLFLRRHYFYLWSGIDYNFFLCSVFFTVAVFVCSFLLIHLMFHLGQRFIFG